MRIIISPAKKMNVDTDTFDYQGLPDFLTKTSQLMEYMKSLDFETCRKVWKCNEKIAEQNFKRFQEMNLEKCLTPAILSYEGIQYQYISPLILDIASLNYLQENLRILSGFYGILKPFDGVVPYRLEMKARLGTGNIDSLYEFWGNELAESLFLKDDTILNLASKEYSKCIQQHLRVGIKFVTCVFGEMIQGKILEKGTFAKMARGEMVRFIAQNRVDDIVQIKGFQRLGYRYYEEYSDAGTMVFLK